MKQAPDRSIVGEFEDVSLGDKRLERRLGVIAQAMESAPGDSLVEQAGDVAALEATYRFLSNERVSPEAIFEGHAAKTAARAQEHDSVLVIHDTTEFRFGGAKERKGLGRVSTKKRDGFLAHYSLCLAPDGEPLGTLELVAWSRLDSDKRPQATGSLRDPNRESLRWVDSAERSSQRLFGRCAPIHMYRKRWIVEEFFKAIKTGCRFESHQLEDIKGLLLALVIESAIAWQILRLRHVARSQPSAPGRNLLTRPQFETLNRLRALRGQPTDNLSVQQVIDELARLGVHLRNNGPPGWAVLKRGLRKLNLLAEGLCLADPAIPTEM